MWRTTLGSTPTAPPPKTSPDSFSTTRRRPGAGCGSVRIAASVTVWVIVDTFPPSACRSRAAATNRSIMSDRAWQGGRGCPSRTSATPQTPPGPEGLGLADLEPHEARDSDAGLVEHLLDGLLVVGHRW